MEFCFSNCERVRYYMGKLYDEKIYVKYDDIKHHHIDNYIKDNDLFYVNKILFVNYCDLKNLSRAIESHELCYFLENIDKYSGYIMCTFGDYHNDIFNSFIISKYRANGDNSIIMKLDSKRHWNIKHLQYINNKDINFKKKKNIVFWRGSPNGLHTHNLERYKLVQKYYEAKNFNIGFYYTDNFINKYFDLTNNDQNIIFGKYMADNIEKYKKNFVDIKKQLKYKYLISVEGNDVATDLKWKLYSNSVVFMKKPTIVSWLMEDKLEPYVHYIPLNDDFSDLQEKYEWAINHEEECFVITKNAQCYIEQFLNEENENMIQCEILRKYFDNFIIEY